MRIKLSKLALSVVIMLAMVVAQSCLEKEDVKPQPVQSTEPSVLEEIKNLGFDAASIEDKGTYYLAEGDIYFAKDKTNARKLPVKAKTNVKPVRSERPAMTIALDQAVAIKQCLEEWYRLRYLECQQGSPF